MDPLENQLNAPMKSRHHLLLVILLSILLAAIIGGYIYYGMQQAQNQPEPVSPEASTETTETVPGISAEERAKLLEESAVAASSSLSVEERAAVMSEEMPVVTSEEGGEADSAVIDAGEEPEAASEPMSADARRAILESQTAPVVEN